MVRSQTPNVPIEAIDRTRYRKMEAAAPIGGSPFPESGVNLISLSVARHADVSRGLAATSWDLLVVDIEGGRHPDEGAAVRQLIDGGKVAKTVLVSSAIGGLRAYSNAMVTEIAPGFEFEAANRGVPPAQSIEVRYTEPEIAVLQATDSLADVMEQSGQALTARARMFRTIARSSGYALERELRLLGKAAGHTAITDDDSHGITPEGPASLPPPQKVLEQAARILELLDRVRVDSKAEALLGLLSARLSPRPSRPIFVISRFANTVDYLASLLSDRGTPAKLLVASMGASEILAVLESLDRPEVTVLTYAVLQGLELPVGATVIVYDPPGPALRRLFNPRLGTLSEVLEFSN
jgi:hypothetical protein